LPEPRSISINDATLNELERLPGVGPVMAQMIVDYRTQVGRFGSVEDLMNVKGLGPKKYEKMAPYVRL
jgi:competence protein ComEA